MAKKDKPTPENTPIPGGGSWRWDYTQPGWVPNDAYAPPPIADAAPGSALPDGMQTPAA
jgi:hypothetical protein